MHGWRYPAYRYRVARWRAALFSAPMGSRFTSGMMPVGSASELYSGNLARFFFFSFGWTAAALFNLTPTTDGQGLEPQSQGRADRWWHLSVTDGIVIHRQNPQEPKCEAASQTRACEDRPDELHGAFALRYGRPHDIWD